MNTSERPRPPEEGPRQPPAAGAGGDLVRLREDAARFAAAGADAIRRALSGDAKTFLAGVKQTSAE